jgi:hypothetical protein
MIKCEKDFIKILVAEGEWIKDSKSCKFRKAKILEKDSIINSQYKELIGKTFNIKYRSNYKNYEDIICIECNGKEIWLEDDEYKFLDELPEYIKDKNEILKLNRTKEFYGGLWLDYEYEDGYKIKNNCSLKVEYILDDGKEYEIATKEEYETELIEAINSRKDYIESKISACQKELKVLENLKTQK